MWNPVPPADRAAAVPLRAKIPADVDAPDRLAFDLTFRQLAVLALAGTVGLVVWAVLARTVPMVPPAVRAVLLVPVAGTALALAVGRRDGLPLDAWLVAATVFGRRPRRLVPVPVLDPPPWAPAPVVPGTGRAAGRRGADGAPLPSGADPARHAERPPALLRLPADAVAPDGTLRGPHRPAASGGPAAGRSRAGVPRPGRATVLVASTTVNVVLRTPAEQAALVAGLGRWLNGLTTGVQIVVSTRRVDLPGRAVRVADRAHHLLATPGDEERSGTRDGTRDGGPAGAPVPQGRAGSGLAAAALDHAEFLLDLAEHLDPLERTVTVAVTATGGPSPATVARRAAEQTVAALTALGAQAAVLDGAGVTALLAAATDPYQPGDAGWARAVPGGVVTGRPLPSSGRS